MILKLREVFKFYLLKGMLINMIKEQKRLCEAIDDLNLKPTPFEGCVVVMLSTSDEIEQYAAARRMPKCVRKRWLYNVAHNTPIILGYAKKEKLKQSVS